MDDLRGRRPHLGLIMRVQPKNWAAVSGGKDATGGTWNRVLPVWVSQSKTLPVFESSDAHEVIRAAARALRPPGDYARQVDVITVPRHVARVFEAKHRPIVEAMISTEAMSQYAERAMAYMIRLAGLFALSERRDEVSERDFDTALALVTYSIQTIAYVLPEAEASEEIALSVKVENFIRDAGEEGVQSTVIYCKFGLRKAEVEPLIASLDTIENFKAASTGGRPAVMYRYVGPTEESAQDIAVMPPVVEPTPLPVLTEETELSDMKPAAPGMAFYLTEDDWDEVDAALEAETVPVAASTTIISLNLPCGVDALRAFMEAMDAPEQLEMQLPSVSLPRGIDSLRALLEAPSEERSPARDASEEQSASPAPKRRRATAPRSVPQAPEVVAA